jgi:hypothetical protein
MGVYVDIQLFNLKAYKEELLPAYQAYSRNKNVESIITLLRDLCQKLGTSPKLSKAIGWNSQECENQIRVLKEGIYIYSDEAKGIFKTIEVSQRDQRNWLRSSIIPRIVEALCVPYDREDVYPEQTLSDSPFANYLYEHSKLFGSFWTFLHKNRSEVLKPAIGETGEALTKEGIQELNAELSKISPPTDPRMRKEYNNFRNMVKLALEDPSLTLVITTA